MKHLRNPGYNTRLSSRGIAVRSTASLPLAYAGRTSIPEAVVIQTRGRGVLDRPPFAGDDGLSDPGYDDNDRFKDN
jgi:hypothetical protein